MPKSSVQVAQLALSAMTVVAFVCWLIVVLCGPMPVALVGIPDIPPPDSKSTAADEVRARTAFYTEVTAAQRQNAAFQREFVATHLIQPVLTALLTALVAAIAIQTGSNVVSTWLARGRPRNGGGPD